MQETRATHTPHLSFRHCPGQPSLHRRWVAPSPDAILSNTRHAASCTTKRMRERRLELLPLSGLDPKCFAKADSFQDSRPESEFGKGFTARNPETTTAPKLDIFGAGQREFSGKRKAGNRPGSHRVDVTTC